MYKVIGVLPLPVTFNYTKFAQPFIKGYKGITQATLFVFRIAYYTQLWIHICVNMSEQIVETVECQKY